MPIWYDRKTVAATEVQFFTTTRAEATNKELDTNMERAYQFAEAQTIKKIIVVISPTLLSSTTARDTTVDDVITEILQNSVIQIQIGRGDIVYYPLHLALGTPPVTGDLEYTLATTADGSYAFLSASGNGLCVDIPVPALTDIKFYIKKATTTSWGRVTIIFITE